MKNNNLYSYKKILDIIETVMKVICQVLLVGIVIAGLLGILTRYLPVSQPIWLGQMAIFLGVWMYFLGFVIAAKNEEYIYIEFFFKFLPNVIQKLLSFLFHIGMLGFCILVVIKGLPLQVIQSRMMVTSFPVPQNFFSMPVLISMGLVGIIVAYFTISRFLELINAINELKE